MTNEPEPLYQRRPLVSVTATLVFIVVAAILFCALGQAFFKPAHANDVIAYPTNTAGWSVCSGGVCAWGEGALPSPNIRQVPQPESQADKDAAAERDRQWVKACDPKLVRDRYGVMHYQYVKAGCEFGSPE